MPSYNPGDALPGLVVGEKIDTALTKLGNTGMLKGTAAAFSVNMSTGVATNISDADYPATTVRGVQYLDGTFYVMEPDGTIWNSLAASNDPTDWPTDGFIAAEFESDTGVFLAKALNYIVALGGWSTELFWDAGNPTGSPLLPVNNGVILVGCAAADSVAQTESTVIWVAQRKAQGSSSQKGRFVAMLVGTSYETISTPDVSRILDADDLATVYSCTIEISGHTWYVLGLGTSDVTLVFDLQMKHWSVWTRLTAGSPVTLTTLTQTNGLATATKVGHGFSDGDPVTISGAAQAGYNLSVNVTVTSSSTFTYPVAAATVSPATGTILATGYTEAYFAIVAATGFAGDQLLLDTAGNVYEFSLSNNTDAGDIPIDWKIRTTNQDFGNNNNKFCFSITPVGDVLASSANGLLRYSDDDYQNWSYYRRIDMSQVRPELFRQGVFRRRAWEWRYTGSQRQRLEALEVKLTQGVT